MPGRFFFYKNANGQLVNNSTATVVQTEAEFKSTVVPVVSATGGSYGAAQTVSPDAGYFQIEPVQIVVTWANYDSGNVNIKVVATYADTTTATFTAATTAANGTQTFNTNDFAAALTTGKSITSLAVSAKNSASSSTVTASVVITGTESQ